MIEQHDGDVCYLQFHHYSAFPALVHGIFTRLGGYSTGPYHSLNTSTPPRGVGGDRVEDVVRNRALALGALGLNEAISLWQVHGSDVVTFDRRDEWRTDWGERSYYERSWTPETIRKGDALLTQERGVALALSFADCVPMLFYDPVVQAIGLAHGGWRGTARGIALATIEAMVERYSSRPEQLYVGIAPAIGPCCYEVSQQVQQLFLGKERFVDQPTREDYQGRVRESAVFTLHGESLRLDLQETNRRQLLMAGVPDGQIEVMSICTSCRSDLFFSHRGEHGKTGRFAVVLGLDPVTS